MERVVMGLSLERVVPVLMSPCSRVLATMIVVPLIASCATSADSTSLPTHDGEVPAAAERGRFAFAGDCFVIETTSGATLPVIWPPGYTRTADGAGVQDENGTVVPLGEDLDVGGGGVPRTPQTPDACEGDEVFFLDGLD